MAAAASISARAWRTYLRGFAMDASVTMFLDCPAYLDIHGATRCGLPAIVQDRYLASATDGPLESVRILCPRGHWLNGPVEILTRHKLPADPRPGSKEIRVRLAHIVDGIPERPGRGFPGRSAH